MKKLLCRYGGLLTLTFLGPTPNTYAGAEGAMFIGSSAFTLVTATDTSDRNPEFHQFNLGLRLTPKDSLSLEKISWRYYAPLGIPYGSAKSSKAEEYPGSVRSDGLGLAYQRFSDGGFYSALHALPLDQTFLDQNGNKIGTGKQLFLTLRFGYHFGKRFFLEPSIAFTHWPVNEGLPASFQAKEDQWPKYFLFEPGLHFGVNL
ncbi:MAG: hypothetical protein A2600_00745 [Candidatus Lambdaproteobacteria bacterium RIFOXYD1_FULL_56_27]|uniref:Outer membrane protein beta-barrel domain-containing protein n=1 Tax=Candidatus Lambdaproteobacteria bacterium RIFOXYD2_FULL_56_26 TaxID=1817773 RepID=A0A1F6GLQ1_9PROT|nr:MAG: hypothetical protein A2557_09775 [Candidatus Lambdaproteobacteria bacterium RIFOXYD2_FULL_56_26]OGH07082.1 MAG: hypothetical protein A2600_00745 [Candidatus Lambdaproteobacteria bacterium RIFOXYD1_FULL_56_27]